MEGSSASLVAKRAVVKNFDGSLRRLSAAALEIKLEGNGDRDELSRKGAALLQSLRETLIEETAPAGAAAVVSLSGKGLALEETRRLCRLRQQSAFRVLQQAMSVSLCSCLCLCTGYLASSDLSAGAASATPPANAKSTGSREGTPQSSARAAPPALAASMQWRLGRKEFGIAGEWKEAMQRKRRRRVQSRGQRRLGGRRGELKTRH